MAERPNYIKEIGGALKKGDGQKVKSFFEENNVSIFERNRDGLTVLDFADKWRDLEVGRCILRKFSHLLDSSSRDRCTGLVFIAIWVGDKVFLEKWLKCGLSLDVCDIREGLTPLHRAAVTFIGGDEPYPGMLSYLLENGADSDSRDTKGLTPLFQLVLTFHNGREWLPSIRRAIFELLAAGADINSQTSSGSTLLQEILERQILTRDFHCIFDLIEASTDANIISNDALSVIELIHSELMISNSLDVEARRPQPFEVEVYESIKVLIYRIIKINVLKLTVDQKIPENLMSDLIKWHDFMQASKLILSERYIRYGFSKDKIESFTKKCVIEKNTLQDMKVNSFTSLYDLIKKGDHELSILARSSMMKEYFNPEIRKYKRDFPIFWRFLQSKYNKGVERNIILPYARESIKLLNIPLPEVCLEHVLKQFRNRELASFVDTISLLKPSILEGNTRMSQILFKKNSFMKKIGENY